MFDGWCCPGPGSSWGNLAVPPASKDAESPSHMFCSVLFLEGRVYFDSVVLKNIRNRDELCESIIRFINAWTVSK